MDEFRKGDLSLKPRPLVVLIVNPFVEFEVINGFGETRSAYQIRIRLMEKTFRYHAKTALFLT